MPVEAHQGSTSQEFRAHSIARWAWFASVLMAILLVVVGFWLAIARPHWMTFLTPPRVVIVFADGRLSSISSATT